MIHVEETQRRILQHLLHRARNTEVGRLYHFESISTPAEYAGRLPIIDFEAIRPQVMRMIAGEADILWPGRCRRFAQSSGTSGGKSKYIPLTEESLSKCHYKGATSVVAQYLYNHPDSRLMSGKSFILGGSYSSTAQHPADCKIGDLSASLIDCITPFAAMLRVPDKKIALMGEWSEKLPRLVEATLKCNVTNMSGVPSWFLTVVRRVMESAGADELHQVWPGLEVFFHGGISFAPYREQYNKIIDPSKMRYMETYNASEGFFALQDDPDCSAMLLLTDVDVYYEFIPISDIDSDSPRVLTAWEVTPGETYSLIITSSNGLWRYSIGDTITVDSTSPLRIRIAGRTHAFINAFGEELMVDNADRAITKASRDTSATIADYTAAPVYATGASRGYHQWLVEFDTMPDSLDRFVEILDKELRQLNSDYDAKRSGNIFLAPPQIIPVPKGTFNRYLASTGRLGGQRKVPRLKNDRTVADNILSFLFPNQKS